MRVSDFPNLPPSLVIFSPINPSSRGEAQFSNLQNLSFTKDQKDFIAKQLCDQFDDLPNIRFGESGNLLLARYHIAQGTAYGWKSNLQKNKVNRGGSTAGAPLYLDDEGLTAVMKEIEEGKAAMVPKVKGKATKAAKKGDKVGKKIKKLRLSSIDLLASIKRHGLKTKIRRGNKDLDPETEPDKLSVNPHTFNKIKKMMKQKAKANGGKMEASAKTVIETTARNKGCGDVRMVVQQATMVQSSMGHLPDAHKVNIDAMSMIGEPNGTGVTLYRIVTEKEAKDFEQQHLKNNFISTNHQESMGCIVKWMQLCTGIGEFGTIVLIVACPGMPPGRFHCAKVRGITNTTDSTRDGYVFFSPTRCMKGMTVEQLAAATKQAEEKGLELPENAWSHYFRHIFTPDMKRIREAHNLRDPATGDLYTMACTIDGESVVNRELLDPRVWTLLDEEGIDLNKNRPSCTKFDNACDASTNFRDCKTGLREVTRKEKDTHCSLLEVTLTAAYKAMREKFPMVTMSADQEKKTKGAIQKFVYVSKCKYVTAIKARDGFVAARQVLRSDHVLERPIVGYENSTVDFYRILRDLCYTSMSEEQVTHIIAMAPRLIAYYRANGRLTYEYMDQLGIMRMPDEADDVNRDDRCLAQQGPLCLTCPETRAREAVYAAKKAGIQVVQESDKQRKSDMEAVKKEANRLANLEKAKEKRKTEKERVAALSPNSKENEKLNKKRKAEAKAEELEAAQRRLDDIL